MTGIQKTISANHVQSGADAVLGIDPSQAPTDPAELNERLTIPQPGITSAVSFLFAQQQSKHLPRALPYVYALLEAAERAFPAEMGEEIKSKAFVTGIAAVATESRAIVNAGGLVSGGLKERQPEIVAFVEKHFAGEGSWVQKLTLDDRIGVYALCLGMIRAIERQLAGAERPVQVSATPGRNEPCHCGSGKKYKKCHGAPDAARA